MRYLLLLALLAASLPLHGCAIAGFGGAMIDSYKRNSTRAVEAEYHGLQGKSYAVVVSADRAIQGEHPDIVPWLTHKMLEVLVQNQNDVGGSGRIPAETILQYQYERPRWIAMPRGQLARELGVERLIMVDLIEYRLHEPGNQYLWSGLATGTVEVFEADSPAPDEAVFQKSVRVAFPDKDGYGPSEMPAQMVATELGRRFVNRTTWNFFRHQEKYYPDY